MKLVAFLRGINVGGKHLVRMTDLKNMFESVGMTNVRTVLASGNVLFESPLRAEAAAQKLATALENHFHFSVPVIVRAEHELTELVSNNPFRKVKVTEKTRLYVSFLPSTPPASRSMVSLPNSIEIVHESKAILCTVLTLSPKFGSPELMALLDGQFGKTVTTRSWETVKKCIGAQSF